MKLILILTFFYICQIALANSSTKTTDTEAALLKAMSKSALRPNSKPQPVVTKGSKLKSNEYSISTDTSRKIFSTKVYEGLLLSSHCFKTKKPDCQALTVSLKKINSDPTKNLKSPYHNNFGANHCHTMGGVGLIAKTFEGHDSDFCEFKDGSLVSSWSAYFKTRPPAEALPR